jgi:hypothetical protein
MSVKIRTDRRAHHRNIRHLLLVPVLYSIFVLDLKLIKWEANDRTWSGLTNARCKRRGVS